MVCFSCPTMSPTIPTGTSALATHRRHLRSVLASHPVADSQPTGRSAKTAARMMLSSHHLSWGLTTLQYVLRFGWTTDGARHCCRLRRGSRVIIYCARNLNDGKVYVGRSCFTLDKVRKRHEHDAFRYGRGFRLAAALREQGAEAFKWTILATANDKEELLNMESAHIDRLDARHPEYGYNVMRGGNGSKLTNEDRVAICKEYATAWEARRNTPSWSTVARRYRVSSPVIRDCVLYWGPRHGFPRWRSSLHEPKQSEYLQRLRTPLPDGPEA